MITTHVFNGVKIEHHAPSTIFKFAKMQSANQSKIIPLKYCMLQDKTILPIYLQKKKNANIDSSNYKTLLCLNLFLHSQFQNLNQMYHKHFIQTHKLYMHWTHRSSGFNVFQFHFLPFHFMFITPSSLCFFNLRGVVNLCM